MQGAAFKICLAPYIIEYSMLNQKILVGYSGTILEHLLKNNKIEGEQIIIFEDDENRLNLINQYKNNFLKVFSFKDGIKYIEESKDDFEVIISISSSPIKRYQIRNLFHSKNLIFPNLIQPTARISDFATFSDGLYFGDFVTVEANAFVNEFSFINNHSHVGHDSIIGKYCVMGGGVVINGNCKISDYCLIGSSVTVINGKKIGMGSVIQAGTCVTSDIPEFSYVSGNPSNVICSSKLLGKQFRMPEK